MPQHNLRRQIGACLLMLIVLAAAGCQKARTADEIKRDYALKILEGFSVGYFEIQAERADPASYTLYNLSIESGDALIYAEQAKILVDAATSTVSLELTNVVGADSRSGMIMSFDDMRSGSVKLAGGVKD